MLGAHALQLAALASSRAAVSSPAWRRRAAVVAILLYRSCSHVLMLMIAHQLIAHGMIGPNGATAVAIATVARGLATGVSRPSLFLAGSSANHFRRRRSNRAQHSLAQEAAWMASGISGPRGRLVHRRAKVALRGGIVRCFVRLTIAGSQLRDRHARLRAATLSFHVSTTLIASSASG